MNFLFLPIPIQTFLPHNAHLMAYLAQMGSEAFRTEEPAL
jgi:hypothetical protein